MRQLFTLQVLTRAGLMHAKVCEPVDDMYVVLLTVTDSL